MPITTLDGLVGAVKQKRQWNKTTTRSSIAGTPFSVFDVAGSPGAGTLAGTSTTIGVVPTSATAGTVPLDTFAGGSVGYLAALNAANTVPSTIVVYDLLWKGGAYAFNASTTGNTPTSFLSRIPGGTAAACAGQTEIWVEQVTAATGNQAVSVTYTNQAGTTNRVTGAFGIGAAPTIGRMWQLPLVSGDTGVSAVTGVAGTVATAGTFNVLVMRPLVRLRIPIANSSDTFDFTRTGLPQIYSDTAFFVQIVPDSTNTGTPALLFDIAVG